MLRTMLSDVDDIYGVADTGVTFEGETDRVQETLHIRGQLTGTVCETCSRCLSERLRTFELPVKWTLLPIKTIDAHRLKDEEEVELSTDDLDTSFYKGDQIDIGELIREALLLELDPAPVCGEEGCDARFEALVRKHIPAEDTVDPRWAALADLKNNVKRSGKE